MDIIVLVTCVFVHSINGDTSAKSFGVKTINSNEINKKMNSFIKNVDHSSLFSSPEEQEDGSGEVDGPGAYDYLTSDTTDYATFPPDPPSISHTFSGISEHSSVSEDSGTKDPQDNTHTYFSTHGFTSYMRISTEYPSKSVRISYIDIHTHKHGIF